MSARTGFRAVAVAAVLGLAVTACTGDGDDDRDETQERVWPKTLAEACVEVSTLLQPSDFESAEGAIDYEHISTELNAFIENGEDERIGEVLQPLADAADGLVGIAADDAEASEAQEGLFDDPSEIPTEILSLEPGEEVTTDLGGGDTAAAEEAVAADEAFSAAREDVGAQCDAEGSPLVDPDAIASENAEIEEDLQESSAPDSEGGDPNESVAPEEGDGSGG